MNFEKSVADLESFQKTVKKMAESDLTTPRRYHELAKLLEALLEQTQKEQAAQRIARKMSDIRRRLGQGRTDQDTQNAEGDVLESLDQLLEKLEAQQGQKPQEGQQSNNPAQDSGILKQSAPGQVDRRSFDVGGEWGDMPPKEREEAMQRIEQDFPAQYRDIVEQYFREMAGQSE